MWLKWNHLKQVAELRNMKEMIYYSLWQVGKDGEIGGGGDLGRWPVILSKNGHFSLIIQVKLSPQIITVYYPIFWNKIHIAAVRHRVG